MIQFDIFPLALSWVSFVFIHVRLFVILLKSAVKSLAYRNVFMILFLIIVYERCFPLKLLMHLGHRSTQQGEIFQPQDAGSYQTCCCNLLKCR